MLLLTAFAGIHSAVMALSVLREAALLRPTTQEQAADETCAPAYAANSINFCKFTAKTISILLVFTPLFVSRRASWPQQTPS